MYLEVDLTGAVLGLVLCLVPTAEDETRLIQYFLKYRTESCLVLDRSDNSEVVSVAATGFGMPAWMIAAERGLISKAQAVEWVNQCIDTIESTNPTKNRGWLLHFMNRTGRPIAGSEVSTIDTALFLCGARLAADKSGDRDLVNRVENLISKVDTDWMLRGRYFSHGVIWKDDQPTHLICMWRDNSEGILLYRLFGVPFTPEYTTDSYPLFVYYYPLCFYHDDRLVSQLNRAVEWQIEKYGVCGITACSSPCGYAVNDPNLISPLAVWAASRYSEAARKQMVESPYRPSLNAHHRHSGWVSGEVEIGIDSGSCLLLLCNQR